MNDEIKEILNQLEKVKDSVGTFIGMDNKGANLLLDYITDLQENYEKEHYLVDKLTRQLNDEYKNTEYQCKQKERLNNIINESAEEILKELEENHHLSYGVALAIRQKLLDYKELKGSDKSEK